jgi:hypothetical protein
MKIIAAGMFFIILSMSVIQKEIIIMLQAPTGD